MPERSLARKTPVKIDVRVLIVEKDGVYNATCLEMGLATAGPDLGTVKRDMGELIVAHLRACAEEGRPQDAFVPAPPEYWRMYAQAVVEGFCRQQKLTPPKAPNSATGGFFSHLAVRSLVCPASHAARP